MKKPLLLLLLMIFSLGFSQQEFTKYYTHTAVRFAENKSEDFKFYENKAAVRFNVSDSKLIIIYTPKGNAVLTPMGDAVKTDKYQEVKVRDSEGEYGILTLFTDEKYGCLVVFPEVYMAFTNL